MEALTPKEWLDKLTREANRASEHERAGIRMGANSAAMLRRSPMESTVQAAGNRMRIRGRVDVRRITDSVVLGVEDSIDKAWSS